MSQEACLRWGCNGHFEQIEGCCHGPSAANKGFVNNRNNAANRVQTKTTPERSAEKLPKAKLLRAKAILTATGNATKFLMGVKVGPGSSGYLGRKIRRRA